MKGIWPVKTVFQQCPKIFLGDQWRTWLNSWLPWRRVHVIQKAKRDRV